MSVSVLFFASLRELAGVERTTIDSEGSVADLVAAIGQSLGDDLASALNQDNVRVAINQTLVPRESEVHADDEVAFLPPVTGG